MIHHLFLRFSRNKLEQLASRIEACLTKLSEEQIWARSAQNQNAVGNLVLHVCGNVRQWIIAGAGGQSFQRDRDGEFGARGGFTHADLSSLLSSTIAQATATLDALPPSRLEQELEIQGYRMTVLEAIYHSVEHFSHHTGQIIFATKLLTGEDLGFYRHLSRSAHSEKTP